MSESYLEKCIQALPTEKQAAARAAFKDIAENGDDSVFSKVLVTLEATSAYSETIPRQLITSGEKLLRDFAALTEGHAQKLTESEAHREEMLRQLIAAQIPQLAKSLALDRIVESLEVQTAELGHVGRGVARLRRARVGGMLLIMALGAVLGAAALGVIFWQPYQAAQRADQFISRLNKLGISMRIVRTERGERLRIEGTTLLLGSAWRKDDRGHFIGADLVFPARGGR